MRNFDIERSFNRPHVRGEFSAVEDARDRFTEADIFPETQVRENPELSEALERWDQGDRSLFAHDHAREVLA